MFFIVEEFEDKKGYDANNCSKQQAMRKRAMDFCSQKPVKEVVYIWENTPKQQEEPGFVADFFLVEIFISFSSKPCTNKMSKGERHLLTIHGLI